MKTITDKSVGKALGWKRWRSSWTRPSTGERGFLPKYTTSLDAIVAEIEARGLHIRLDTESGFTKQWMDAVVWQREPEYFQGSGRAKTIPLALCAALLAYLKVTKSGKAK